MNKILDYVILDNSIRSYCMVAGTILLVVFLKRILSRYIAGLLFKVVQKIARGIDKPSFVNLVVSPLETFLLLVVSIISLDKLNFPAILNFKVYKITLHSLIDGVAVIVVIITFIWLLLRIIDFIALILHQKAEREHDQQDNQLVVFFKDFFKVMLVIVGILMVLKFAFSYPITNLITALSIGGAAIALATRESLENLIASFIIFIDKPFMVGDTVKVQTITGTVEKIGLRSTRIRTDQKTYVTMPNKQMVDSIMDNLSLRTQRKGTVQLELTSDTSRETLHQLVLAVEQILQSKRDQVEASSVFLSDIIKNSFIVQVEFFTAPVPVADFNAIRQDIYFSVIDLLDEMNIRLAAKENEIVVTRES